ncbi:DUF2334 domain-containing protein [Pajaroellobacter abortibovis]|uniref:DUF2334 domain-containing protein n=1 Tax=Pajaroellobacter abortibovis TaxID=1882918 RepID=A0A1L6MVV0_9BACT|nr:polysaccharide deacetylase family protein [Pajaroellobacter abortibovis]APR99646.1 hypothetical protein BCY86_02370 [Pajaroellobacter abortibovis]
MRIHVSIHDVSPVFAEEVEAALAYCRQAGVVPTLLVVPNFHGQWPLSHHPDFCARLRKLQGQGHEIFLHGLTHQSRTQPPSKRVTHHAPTLRPSQPTGLSWHFAQRMVSNYEAEFFDLSLAEADERLQQGIETFNLVGLQVHGFIPPAWSMPCWMLSLLAKHGFSFTEDHTTIYNPCIGLKKKSVVLNYATRSPARLLSTAAYCRLMRHAHRITPLRFVIHPTDMRYVLIRHEIERFLKWGKGAFVPKGEDLFAYS